MKIAVVMGSIREGRLSEPVSAWVHDAAAKRTGFEYEVLDLREFNVPLLTSSVSPGLADKEYDDPAVSAWSKAVDSYDGYIFVTPEYNHGVPGPFKNAVDSLAGEWQGKTVAFVSYGADGGVRAVEQWRQILANFSMYDVRQQVSLNLFTEFGENGLQLEDRRATELTVLFDQLEEATKKLRG